MRYHVRRWGTPGAPRLFVVHGWMDSSASFQFMVDALKADWDIIAPDWRGYGLSQRQQRPYWFAEYLGDLDALLGHYSPDEPVRLVGHSMGGNIASLYAGVRPQRVSRLANLEGFGLQPTSPEEAPERYAKWLDQLRAGASLRRHAGREALAERLRKENPRLTTERSLFLVDHMGEAVEGGWQVRADAHHRMVNPVLYRIEEAMACWRRVTAPVLWVAGAQSPLLAKFDANEAHYRARIACFATLSEARLDDAGHMLQHDQPEKLADLLEAFFLA